MRERARWRVGGGEGVLLKLYRVFNLGLGRLLIIHTISNFDLLKLYNYGNFQFQ
jgi:hypothetical protein